MNEKQLLNDFLSYVKINTKSDPSKDYSPSFKGICDLAALLEKQLLDLVDSVYFDRDHCYVYGYLKANTSGKKAIGFNAHMDTSPSESGENIKPRIFTYKGGDVKLNDNTIIKKEEIPDWEEKIGKTMITANGDTLLGADDKAGIAIIINLLRVLKDNIDIKHGDIYVAFTPDEEIGIGTKYFDMKHFKVDFAFTIDGGGIGEFNLENFNAVNGKINFYGYNVHTGSAYKKMINSVRAAAYFISLLPSKNTPEETKNDEGFIHFDSVKGDPNHVVIDILIRNFSEDGIIKFKELLNEMKRKTEAEFNGIKIEFELKDAYYNMKKIVDKFPEVVNIVEKSAQNIGLILKKIKIRGGTDGAMLSNRVGLPIPNLFTGGYNFHSKKEFAILEEMKKGVELLVEIVKNG